VARRIFFANFGLEVMQVPDHKQVFLEVHDKDTKDVYVIPMEEETAAKLSARLDGRGIVMPNIVGGVPKQG